MIAKSCSPRITLMKYRSSCVGVSSGMTSPVYSPMTVPSWILCRAMAPMPTLSLMWRSSMLVSYQAVVLRASHVATVQPHVEDLGAGQFMPEQSGYGRGAEAGSCLAILRDRRVGLGRACLKMSLGHVRSLGKPMGLLDLVHLVAGLKMCWKVRRGLNCFPWIGLQIAVLVVRMDLLILLFLRIVYVKVGRLRLGAMIIKTTTSQTICEIRYIEYIYSLGVHGFSMMHYLDAIILRCQFGQTRHCLAINNVVVEDRALFHQNLWRTMLQGNQIAQCLAPLLAIRQCPPRVAIHSPYLQRPMCHSSYSDSRLAL